MNDVLQEAYQEGVKLAFDEFLLKLGRGPTGSRGGMGTVAAVQKGLAAPMRHNIKSMKDYQGLMPGHNTPISRKKVLPKK